MPLLKNQKTMFITYIDEYIFKPAQLTNCLDKLILCLEILYICIEFLNTF